MGTPELAEVGLKTLLDSDFFDICAIVTKVDSSSGRNMQINKSAVKLFIEQYNSENNKNIPILQPEKLKEIREKLEKINPDLIVVIAYGKILPQSILDTPKHGCINVHASLLPKYRGSACIPAPILNGDKKSGLTIMKMDAGMDTGNIIEQIEIDLNKNETSISLMEKIKIASAKNLSEIIYKYTQGELQEKAQNNEETTYVKMTEKEDGYLNFEIDSAEIVEKKVRAFQPWPGTYAYLEKDDLPKKKILFKILQVSNNFIEAPQIESGKIFLQNNNLAIKCQNKAIVIKKLQLEGKKPMITPDFLKGNDWVMGKILK